MRASCCKQLTTTLWHIFSSLVIALASYGDQLCSPAAWFPYEQLQKLTVCTTRTQRHHVNTQTKRVVSLLPLSVKHVKNHTGVFPLWGTSERMVPAEVPSPSLYQELCSGNAANVKILLYMNHIVQRCFVKKQRSHSVLNHWHTCRPPSKMNRFFACAAQNILICENAIWGEKKELEALKLKTLSSSVLQWCDGCELTF